MCVSGHNVHLAKSDSKKFLVKFFSKKLVPLFREAAYTKIKKLVGETTPEDFEEMKEKVQKASDAAIAKKDKVIKHIRGQ